MLRRRSRSNELCETIEGLDLNRYLIEHLEDTYGIELKNLDIYMIQKYLEDVYTIEASNNNEFAQNYIKESSHGKVYIKWQIQRLKAPNQRSFIYVNIKIQK